MIKQIPKKLVGEWLGEALVVFRIPNAAVELTLEQLTPLLLYVAQQAYEYGQISEEGRE